MRKNYPLILTQQLLPKLGGLFLFFICVFVSGQKVQVTGEITLSGGAAIMGNSNHNPAAPMEIATIVDATVPNPSSSKLLSENKIAKNETKKRALEKQIKERKSIQKKNVQVAHKIKPPKKFISNTSSSESFAIQNVHSGCGLAANNYKGKDFINPEIEFVFQIISYQHIQNTFYHYYKARKVNDSCFARPPPLSFI